MPPAFEGGAAAVEAAGSVDSDGLGLGGGERVAHSPGDFGEGEVGVGEVAFQFVASGGGTVE